MEEGFLPKQRIDADDVEASNRCLTLELNPAIGYKKSVYAPSSEAAREIEPIAQRKQNSIFRPQGNFVITVLHEARGRISA